MIATCQISDAKSSGNYSITVAPDPNSSIEIRFHDHCLWLEEQSNTREKKKRPKTNCIRGFEFVWGLE
ncbi:hypothetical protein DITRI_Ditri20bG0074800 [Diplodiscus trichospermus]